MVISIRVNNWFPWQPQQHFKCSISTTESTHPHHPAKFNRCITV